MNIIKHKWIFLTFSSLLIVASIFGLFAFGLEKGIDFTGGTYWQIEFAKPAELSDVRTFVQTDLKLADAVVNQL
jgi:preprotein translocase subunit SecF